MKLKQSFLVSSSVSISCCFSVWFVPNAAVLVPAGSTLQHQTTGLWVDPLQTTPFIGLIPRPLRVMGFNWMLMIICPLMIKGLCNAQAYCQATTLLKKLLCFISLTITATPLAVWRFNGIGLTNCIRVCTDGALMIPCRQVIRAPRAALSLSTGLANK